MNNYHDNFFKESAMLSISGNNNCDNLLLSNLGSCILQELQLMALSLPAVIMETRKMLRHHDQVKWN